MIILKERNSCQKNKKDEDEEAAEQRINCLWMTMLNNCKRHSNLSMAQIDYNKEIEFVPHSWINECMELFGIADKIRNFLEKSMKQWKLSLTSNGEDIGEVDGKRGIYWETVCRHCCLSCVWCPYC